MNHYIKYFCKKKRGGGGGECLWNNETGVCVCVRGRHVLELKMTAITGLITLLMYANKDVDV